MCSLFLRLWIIRQKWEVWEVIKMALGWREEAEHYYFECHWTYNEIEIQIGVSRKSIAEYIKTCPKFTDEITHRQEDQKEFRKAYQREWDRKHRKMSIPMGVTEDTLRREHDQAVKELSLERY